VRLLGMACKIQTSPCSGSKSRLPPALQRCRPEREGFVSGEVLLIAFTTARSMREDYLFGSSSPPRDHILKTHGSRLPRRSQLHPSDRPGKQVCYMTVGCGDVPVGFRGID